MKKQSGIIIYSPTDLIRYLASPFASWLDRYYLENPDAIAPDKQTEEEENDERSFAAQSISPWHLSRKPISLLLSARRERPAMHSKRAPNFVSRPNIALPRNENRPVSSAVR